MLNNVNDQSRGFYKEMNNLIVMLAKADIPFEVAAFPYKMRDGDESIQIFCPSMEHSRIDAVSHFGTYGYERGLIETMSDLRPDVDGYLTAEEAFQFFKDVWEDEQGKS
jgi:hypothetical protein